MNMSLDQFQQMTFEWSIQTFGIRSASGPLNHLKAECDEAAENPSDITEFADIYLLMADAAARAGHKMSEVFQAAQAKHRVNISRDWGGGEANEQGFTEHIRIRKPGL